LVDPIDYKIKSWTGGAPPAPPGQSSYPVLRGSDVQNSKVSSKIRNGGGIKYLKRRGGGTMNKK